MCVDNLFETVYAFNKIKCDLRFFEKIIYL